MPQKGRLRSQCAAQYCTAAQRIADGCSLARPALHSAHRSARTADGRVRTNPHRQTHLVGDDAGAIGTYLREEDSHVRRRVGYSGAQNSRLHTSNESERPLHTRTASHTRASAHVLRTRMHAPPAWRRRGTRMVARTGQCVSTAHRPVRAHEPQTTGPLGAEWPQRGATPSERCRPRRMASSANSSSVIAPARPPQQKLATATGRHGWPRAERELSHALACALRERSSPCGAVRGWAAHQRRSTTGVRHA
jgi:hypothetical protein